VLTEPTMEKLRLLRLDALGGAWVEQQKNPELQKLASRSGSSGASHAPTS